MDKKCYICDNDYINLFEKIRFENNELYESLIKKGELWSELARRGTNWIFPTDDEYLKDLHYFWSPVHNRYKQNSRGWWDIDEYSGEGEKHFDICGICFWKDSQYNVDFFKTKVIEEGFLYKRKVLTVDVENIKKNKEKWKKQKYTECQEAIKSHSKKIEIAKKEKEKLENDIVGLLKEKAIKLPVSDINALLKYGDIDEIKKTCEEMYENGKIDFAGNGRYFILSEEKKKPKPKKTSASKSEEVDVEKELEKYKGLLDKGLITQEAYDAKMNQLLGL